MRLEWGRGGVERGVVVVVVVLASAAVWVSVEDDVNDLTESDVMPSDLG